MRLQFVEKKPFYIKVSYSVAKNRIRLGGKKQPNGVRKGNLAAG